MNIISLIIGVLCLALGALMIIFPDFFVELTLLRYNEFLYWSSSGKPISSSRGMEIFTRVIGCIISACGIFSIIAAVFS